MFLVNARIGFTVLGFGRPCLGVLEDEPHPANPSDNLAPPFHSHQNVLFPNTTPPIPHHDFHHSVHRGVCDWSSPSRTSPFRRASSSVSPNFSAGTLDRASLLLNGFVHSRLLYAFQGSGELFNKSILAPFQITKTPMEPTSASFILLPISKYIVVGFECKINKRNFFPSSNKFVTMYAFL